MCGGNWYFDTTHFPTPVKKANTKGKLATRSIPVIEDLRQLLTNYYPIRGDVYLFPARSNGHLAEDSAARILREACKQVGRIGVSTHSFRRTALTQMSNAGIPLRVIQLGFWICQSICHFTTHDKCNGLNMALIRCSQPFISDNLRLSK